MGFVQVVNVGFCGEGKTGAPGGKPLRAEKRTNKLNPHMTPSLGIKSRPHWWETSALTTTRSLLSLLCSVLFKTYLPVPRFAFQTAK